METYSFAARITKIDAKFMSYILIIPQDIIESINAKGRVRVEGTMNGAPFALAIQNLKTGEKYFSMSKSLRKAANVKYSVPVKVEFHLVDPDKLDIPEELTAVLNEDPEGKAIIDEMTVGMKRSLVHYITSVKNVDSRIKRALELVEKAKNRELYGQKDK
jgi:outer membrane lipopolysaccharide assembly protein LptE/RlpB